MEKLTFWIQKLRFLSSHLLWGAGKCLDTICKQACCILQIQNMHLKQPAREAQFNAASDVLWASCWINRSCRIVCELAESRWVGSSIANLDPLFCCKSRILFRVRVIVLLPNVNRTSSQETQQSGWIWNDLKLNWFLNSSFWRWKIKDVERRMFNVSELSFRMYVYIGELRASLW